MMTKTSQFHGPFLKIALTELKINMLQYYRSHKTHEPNFAQPCTKAFMMQEEKNWIHCNWVTVPEYHHYQMPGKTMQLVTGPPMFVSYQQCLKHEFCSLCHHFCTA